VEFGWDPAKAELNVQNHGISFEVAACVFADRFRIEEDDPEPSELRQRAIGLVGDKLLFVVFTMRGDVCRIISARPADRRDRRRYHEGE
jgi:uncharacterized protein